jgi:hypothetical protein
LRDLCYEGNRKTSLYNIGSIQECDGREIVGWCRQIQITRVCVMWHLLKRVIVVLARYFEAIVLYLLNFGPLQESTSPCVWSCNFGPLQETKSPCVWIIQLGSPNTNSEDVGWV